ncbi:MAG: hypothetical protein ACREMO_04045 [Gemmatimonadales bacterium]
MRVRAQSFPERLTGTVASIAHDTMTIRLDQRGKSASVPVAAIQRLEVSNGKKTRFWHGAGIGALVGVFVGVAIGDAAASPYDGYASIVQAGGGILGALSGGLIGGVFGSISHTDRWENLEPHRLRATVAPAGAPGVGVGISLRF